MRVDLRQATIVLGVTASIALTGCSTWNWKFWQSSPAPVAAPVEPAPSSGPTVVTARPTATVEASTVPDTNGFARSPELADVHFESGRVTVQRADVKTLDVVAGWLKEHPAALVMIEAHTDDLGARDENLMIGEKRAAAIMKYLVSKGIRRERIAVSSYGPDRPLCTDNSNTCRAKNRRVRFLVKQP
jgi:outer membrane protein OmpA-like peptidoglycan-associated protein